MAPAIIADSDDDDEIGYSPPPRRDGGPVPEEEVPKRSSDYVSEVTKSTDPDFFQSVFNEQNAAARDRSRGVRSERSSGKTEHTTSRQRLNVGTTSMPEQANSGMDQDPWAIPSSPESQAEQETIGRSHGGNLEKSRTTSAKGSKSVSRLNGNGDQDPEESQSGDGLDDKPVRTSRKRKRADPYPVSQDSSAVNLVDIPSSNDHDTAAAAMPPPAPSSALVSTLPVDSETSFFIAPNTLTPSQKMQYEAIPLSSSGPNDNLVVHRWQHINPDPGSSGSVTNANTPRSDNVSSREQMAQPAPRDTKQGDEAKRLRTPRGRRNSSPDVICALAPVTGSGGVSVRAVKGKGKGKRPLGNTPSDNEDEKHHEEPPAAEIPAEDDESDYEMTYKPQKTKKQRGRPKKKVATEHAQIPPSVESSTKQKKKRGRPKKSDARVAEPEKSPAVDSGEVVANEPVEAGLLTPNDAEERVEIPPNRDTDASATKGSGKSATSKGGNKRSAIETKSDMPNDTPSKSPKLNNPDEEVQPASDATPTKQEDENSPGIQAKKNENASVIRKTPSWANAAKPLYRVGLSKSRRIAPLLKSLPKGT